MSEQADETDSKSVGRDTVWVRFPLSALGGYESMLSKSDITRIGKDLMALGLPYRFGYAGSYAQDEATDSSDLDIVISGALEIAIDDYMSIYNLLKEIGLKFDIVNLDALAIADEDLDAELISWGLGVNSESAYKTIKKDVIWFG